jgi:hypothetical protein
MAQWGTWLAIVGGIVAIAGQWVAGYWLPVVGGVLAILGAVVAMMAK